MARFGFDFNPPPADQVPPISYDSANLARRYGVSDPRLAQRDGYQLPASQNRKVTSYDFYDVNADMVYDLFVPKGAKLPATYHGVPIPEGGCVGESDRVVGTFDETPAGRIDTQNWERMKKDPRVLAADRSWSACMKTKGYAVGNPYDALNLAFSSQGIQLSREISMAVADVACKTSTGLVTVYFSVETQLQNQAIKAQRSRLDAADYGQQLIGLYRVFEKYEAPLRNTA